MRKSSEKWPIDHKTLKKEDIKKLMEITHTPGLSLQTVINGKLSQSIILGVTDKSTMTLVGEYTTFQVASLSKTLLYMIADHIANDPRFKGKFQLNTPLNAILKHERVGDHPLSEDFTAERILSHQSGFPGWDSGPKRRFELRFKPGDGYGYSGPAYFYLQQVLEKVTGEKLEDLAHRIVFQPLGMEHSSFRRPKHLTVAVGHTENGEPQHHEVDLSHFEGNIAFSLITTANDYGLFMKYSMEKLRRAFNPEVFMTKDQWAIERQVPNETLKKIAWGLGWGLQSTDQGTIAFHWGDFGESKAFVAMKIIDQKNEPVNDGIVIMTNGHNGLSLMRNPIAAIVGNVDPLFEFLNTKYGFENHDSPDWEIKQKFQTWQIFSRLEITDKPAWISDLLDSQNLQIDYHPDQCILSMNCTEALFLKIIRNELEAFNYENKNEVGECSFKPATDQKDSISSLTLKIPHRELFDQFINKLIREEFIPADAITTKQSPFDLNPFPTPTPWKKE